MKCDIMVVCVYCILSRYTAPGDESQGCGRGADQHEPRWGGGGYTLNPVDAYLESAPDFNP
jgi:hypothetical protein